MSKTLSFGYTDSVATTKTLSGLPTISYAADYATIEDKPGQCIITNTTSPVDQPETIRYAANKVANVYTGTGIDPNLYAVSKQGSSVVVQIKDILRATESTTGIAIDYPIEAHLVVKTPRSSDVTVSYVTDVIKRLIGACLTTDSSDLNDKFKELLRSACKPSEM